VPQPKCDTCGVTMRWALDAWRCVIRSCAAYWDAQQGATGAPTEQLPVRYSPGAQDAAEKSTRRTPEPSTTVQW
jgi:hypothetical protein